VIESNFEKLKEFIDGFNRILIPVSGGLDSTFLLFFTRKHFPEKRLWAVHFSGPFFYEEDDEFIRELCEDLGVMLFEREFNHFSLKIDSEKRRCALCKSKMLEILESILVENGGNYIFSSEVSGENLDLRDGFKILKKNEKVIFPLLESKITKEDIVRYFNEAGRKDLIRPKNSCLLTRFGADIEVNSGDLERIKRGERFIRSLGFKDVIRLRLKGKNTCIIEISMNELREKILNLTTFEFLSFMDGLGFKDVFLDLKGYGEF